MRPRHRLTSVGAASLIIALLLSLLGTPHSAALAASAPAQASTRHGLLPPATPTPSNTPVVTSTPTPVQPSASVSPRTNSVAVGNGVVVSVRSDMTIGTYTLTVIDQSTGQEQDQSNPIFTPARLAPFTTSSGAVSITLTAARPGTVILRLKVSGEYYQPICNCLTWGLASAESEPLTAVEGATQTPIFTPASTFTPTPTWTPASTFTPTPTRTPTPTPSRPPTITPTPTPTEPSVSVAAAASSVQTGGTLVVSATSNLSLVGYTLTVIDQSTGQEQDQSNPIFTPARPEPIVGKPGVVFWTLTAARPGAVAFRVSAYGEFHGGACGCYYFTTVVASSSPVSVTGGPTATDTPTPTRTPTPPPTYTPTPTPTPTPAEPGVSVTVGASSVPTGGTLVVSATSNLSLVGYTLTVIDQSTGQEQDQSNPIFTPARPEPIVGKPGVVFWTLTAARPGAVAFRVSAYGEFHGGACGCYYFTTVVASSSPVSVTDTPTPTPTSTPTSTPVRIPTPSSTEPSVSVTAAASSVQTGGALVVSATSNLSLVGYTLTVIDQSTGQEQDQNNPIFTPARPGTIRVSSGGVAWTLTAARPGAVIFRVSAYGEFHGGACGCYYFTTVDASSSPVSVTGGPTPIYTPTPTDTPTPGGPALKAQYKVNDRSATDKQIKPGLRLVNTGGVALALSDIKLRYWYTQDGAQGQTYSCDYAVVGCANVTGTFGAPAHPASTADRYLEIGFKSGAGSLAPGAGSGEIQSRINKTDWSRYNEANDYSYGGAQTSFADWSKVTVYYKGALIWGTEPKGLPRRPPRSHPR